MSNEWGGLGWALLIGVIVGAYLMRRNISITLKQEQWQEAHGGSTVTSSGHGSNIGAILTTLILGLCVIGLAIVLIASTLKPAAMPVSPTIEKPIEQPAQPIAPPIVAPQKATAIATRVRATAIATRVSTRIVMTPVATFQPRVRPTPAPVEVPIAVPWPLIVAVPIMGALDVVLYRRWKATCARSGTPMGGAWVDVSSEQSWIESNDLLK